MREKLKRAVGLLVLVCLLASVVPSNALAAGPGEVTAALALPVRLSVQLEGKNWGERVTEWAIRIELLEITVMLKLQWYQAWLKAKLADYSNQAAAAIALKNVPALTKTLENLAGQDGITMEAVYYTLYRYAVNQGATNAQATNFANAFRQVIYGLIAKR